MNFDFPNPDEVELTYKFGDVFNLEHFENRKPVFKYEYISMNATEKCFNCPSIDTRIAIEYFKQLKTISQIKVSELLEAKHTDYRFELLNMRYNSKFYEFFRQNFKKDYIKDKDMPMIGKFELFTDPREIEEIDGKEVFKKTLAPRVYFFVSQYGIFNLMYLDLYHDIIKTSY